MAPPPKQSSFVEGSMNDRVSAVPPADFLGTGEEPSADYARQFAMDWKPPELQFEPDGGSGGDNGGGVGGGGGCSNVPGNRSSFMSARSGMSALTTPTGAAPSMKSSKGFLGKVKEKLHKSRSSWTLGGGNDEDGGGNKNNNEEDDKSSFRANFLLPPVFKHTRSESMDHQRSTTSDGHNQPTNDFGGVFQRTGRPALPLRADSLGATMLPGSSSSSYDPSKRPSRDEITANYQSLLASGFFGTHAIQSTRFSPPGAANLNRSSEPAPDAPSFACRMEEEPEEVVESGSIPPSPLRQPPPVPPPNREPPPPPPPPPADDMEMEVEENENEDPTPTQRAIPVSSTAVFSPFPPAHTSRAADTTMSPPPLPKQRTQQNTPTHKPAPRPASKPPLTFAAVPYASTRPGVEPTNIQRPYRPPPNSLARFSVDSSTRPRSMDLHQRGTKRPFSSSTANNSQTSLYTDRSSYDYDPMAMDGHGGIGVATTTASPEKPQSGARKFVKRLKTSASKLSFRSGSAVAKFDDDGEDGGELQHPPSRTSMSSTVKRSFSWKLGSASKPADSTTPTISNGHHQPSASVSSFSSSHNNIFGDGSTFSLNNGVSSTNSSMDHFQLHSTASPPPPPPAPPFPSNHSMGLPAIAASPTCSPATDRKLLKKREIRTRRLQRRGGGDSSPVKQDAAAGNWQAGMPPASPSKRPRRSDASIFMRALDYNTVNGTGMGDDDEDEEDSEPEMPAPIVAAGEMPSAAPSDGMEGVEFSFHLPGRMRPAASRRNSYDGVGGGPLTVVPSANRGSLPSVEDSLGLGGGFRGRKAGSVRVVRAE